MKRPILFLTCALALASAASATQAAVAHPVLGMTSDAARTLFPQARRLQAASTQTTVLELADVDFAGMRWSVVDLVFDAQNRLDHVQLTTRTRTFDEIKTEIVQRYDEVARETRLVSDPVSSLQIRLCDRGAAGVVVTWERPSQAV